ncbi:MAG: hypothetical protein LQ340_007147, partial [Diploschistes diacapsis]
LLAAGHAVCFRPARDRQRRTSPEAGDGEQAGGVAAGVAVAEVELDRELAVGDLRGGRELAAEARRSDFGGRLGRSFHLFKKCRFGRLSEAQFVARDTKVGGA